MTQEQIEQAYAIADDYVFENKDGWTIEDIVQIGVQMALQGEVLFDEDGEIIRID